MTYAEAIPYLEYLSDLDFSKKYPKMPIVSMREQVEALKLAITALQVQDKLQDIEYMCRLSGGADYFRVYAALSEKVNNSNDGVKNANANSTNEIKSRVKGMTACRVPEDDYISRQEAIDVCMKYNGQGYVWSCIMGDLRKLPSVQPVAKDTNVLNNDHQQTGGNTHRKRILPPGKRGEREVRDDQRRIYPLAHQEN